MAAHCPPTPGVPLEALWQNGELQTQRYGRFSRREFPQQDGFASSGLPGKDGHRARGYNARGYFYGGVWLSAVGGSAICSMQPEVVRKCELKNRGKSTKTHSTIAFTRTSHLPMTSGTSKASSVA
jgi:hypothetical protein